MGLALERDPQRLAGALNGFLAERVAAVAHDWRSGGTRPLDLAPIHCPGTTGQEGGGLLYYRLAATLDAWAAAGSAPRRFTPKDVPRGLLQAVGHTQHRKVHELLPEHVPLQAARPGQLRRAVFDAGFDYAAGLEAGMADSVMWFFDGGLHKTPAQQVELMPFAAFLPDRP